MFKGTEDELVDLLRQVKEELDEHNIEFWLDCGTLLGAVREGKFLSWENDIDLGTWREKVPEDVKTSVSKRLCEKGFNIWIAEDHMNILSKRMEKRVFEEIVFIDINFYRLDNYKAIKPTLIPKNLLGRYLSFLLPTLIAPHHPRILGKSHPRIEKKIINISKSIPFLLRKQIARIGSFVYKKIGSEDVSWVVPCHYFVDLSAINFYGMEFKVPANPEKYLAYRYGKDWRVPRKNWITSENDGSVIRKKD